MAPTLFARLLAVLGAWLVRLGYHLQDRAQRQGAAVEARGISASRTGELLVELTEKEREILMLRRLVREGSATFGRSNAPSSTTAAILGRQAASERNLDHTLTTRLREAYGAEVRERENPA